MIGGEWEITEGFLQGGLMYEIGEIRRFDVLYRTSILWTEQANGVCNP